LGIAAAADALLADPHRWHPVAGFGRAASWLEEKVWADNRSAGFGYVAVCVGVPAITAAALDRLIQSPLARAVLLGATTWATLGGESLVREGSAMAALLEADDLAGARDRLSHLCGRDPTGLPAGELCRATVESLAENTSDAVVAPLFWAAVAGLPGVVAYRAVNTLDAMVGHHTARYENFGWAAARLDDLANLLPARLTAALTCALAPTVDGSPRTAWQVVRRNGGDHPSPNAGRCEAAFAGALGLRLGGRNVYAGRVEERGGLGEGAPPAVTDISRTARLSRSVGWAAAAVLAVGTWWRR
jgi:adenosylcobinamide-phosphate synthase